MALTKTDLKAIGKMVREEIEAESKNLNDNLGGELRITKLNLRESIEEQSDKLKNLQIGMISIGKDIKEVKKRVKKIEKTTDIIIDAFDKADVKLQKRVTKIEEHLGLAPKN